MEGPSWYLIHRKLVRSGWRRVAVQLHLQLPAIFLTMAKVSITQTLVFVANLTSFVGIGRPIIHSPTPKYPSHPIRPSFPSRNYSSILDNSIHRRISALQPPLQTLDRNLEPSPPIISPQLGASDSSSPSNGTGLLTPSTRYHSPLLPSPFSNSPAQLGLARPTPADSPAPSPRSLSSASRSASRCSSISSSRSPLRIESHPRLGAISVAPRLKKGTPPPVPVIPEKYRRERSAERWLVLPRKAAEARRGSGGSLGTLRQAKSMENLSQIGYETETVEDERVEVGRYTGRPLSHLEVSIPEVTQEPILFEERSSGEGEFTSAGGPNLDNEITTLASYLHRSRSPSVLAHGPVLHVDETFEEGMTWLHVKNFQGGSGGIQVEKTPNWFERSRTPSPIRAASPYLTAFHGPADSVGCAKTKISGPGMLAKKLSGSFGMVSRGLRHVTSSSGLGIMMSHEGDLGRSSSSTQGSVRCADGRITPHESASLSSSSDGARFSGRNDSWRGPNGGPNRDSKWSARGPVVRLFESEPSVSGGDRESVRLVDFLNEVSVVLPLQILN
jgi:hypothetical protein